MGAPPGSRFCPGADVPSVTSHDRSDITTLLQMAVAVCPVKSDVSELYNKTANRPNRSS